MAPWFFMNRFATHALVLLAAAALMPTLQAQVPMPNELADPYLWLEEVDGVRALDFARAASTRTLSELRDRAEFAQIRDEVREVLDSRERIAQVARARRPPLQLLAGPRRIRAAFGAARRGLNIESRSPHGKRCSTLTHWRATKRKTGFGRMRSACRRAVIRCLISLSRGGGDAIVVREFDLAKKQFVA